MPKHEDAPETMVCDGCGLERSDMSEEPNAAGYHYCDMCRARRATDPQVTVQGRTMLASELRAQAENDKDLAAALEGDTVQDQMKAAKR